VLNRYSRIPVVTVHTNTNAATATVVLTACSHTQKRLSVTILRVENVFGCGRWYAPSPRHLRSLLSAGGWFFVWSCVVVFLSCRVLFLLCVCGDLVLFLRIPVVAVTRI